MMNMKIEEAFKKCHEFIESHTPEELAEYEESLGLNPDDYKDGITFDDLKVGEDGIVRLEILE